MGRRQTVQNTPPVRHRRNAAAGQPPGKQHSGAAFFRDAQSRLCAPPLQLRPDAVRALFRHKEEKHRELIILRQMIEVRHRLPRREPCPELVLHEHPGVARHVVHHQIRPPVAVRLLAFDATCLEGHVDRCQHPHEFPECVCVSEHVLQRLSGRRLRREVEGHDMQRRSPCQFPSAVIAPGAHLTRRRHHLASSPALQLLFANIDRRHRFSLFVAVPDRRPAGAQPSWSGVRS